MDTRSTVPKHLHSVKTGQVAQSYGFWARSSHRPSAYQSAMGSVAQFVAFVGEDTPLIEVTELHVQRYIKERLENVKANTVRGEHARLRAFFSWCVERGLMSYNIAALARPPAEDHPMLRSTSEEEFARLVAYTYGTEAEYRNRAVLYLLHDTGMRVGECNKLDVRDVDIENRIVTIRPETAKTHRARRAPFTEDCAGALFDYLTYVRDWKPGPLWISMRSGEPLEQQALKHELRKLGKRAGIEFGAHDLRRAFVDRCLAAGMAESLIQQITGHESQAMIRRYGRHNADQTATAIYRKLMG